MKEELNFNEIAQMIEIRKNNAYRKVNEELIGLYWDFGKYISEKIKLEKWGNKVIDKLANFMKENYPTLKSDSMMAQAMNTYNEVEENIAASRRFYNSAVLELNNAVEIFPSSVISQHSSHHCLV